MASLSPPKRAEQYHYYESVNDIIELTAIYIIGIAKAHAFPDGNKRTSFLSTTYFLDMNGYVLEENSELPDIIEQAAEAGIYPSNIYRQIISNPETPCRTFIKELIYFNRKFGLGLLLLSAFIQLGAI